MNIEDYRLPKASTTLPSFEFETSNLSTGFPSLLTPVRNGNTRFGELIALIAMTALSALINLRVFFVVIQSRKRRQRSVSLLIAHLTALTTVANIFEALFYADKAKVVILRAEGLCEILSFTRNVLHGALPLNVFVIIYRRVRTFMAYTNGNHGK